MVNSDENVIKHYPQIEFEFTFQMDPESPFMKMLQGMVVGDILPIEIEVSGGSDAS